MKAPMLKIPFLAAIAASALTTGMSSPPTPKPQPMNDVNLAGVLWHGSLEDAEKIAQQENKPILHLQIFGRLDDAYC